MVCGGHTASGISASDFDPHLSFNSTSILKKIKTIVEARSEIAKWHKYYNEDRPHGSLDYLTPKEFAEREMGLLEKPGKSLVLKTG
ncbi:MAG: integrase core domain-containing protein [Pseudobdellovibrionaceae bacterium]